MDRLAQREREREGLPLVLVYRTAAFFVFYFLFQFSFLCLWRKIFFLSPHDLTHHQRDRGENMVFFFLVTEHEILGVFFFLTFWSLYLFVLTKASCPKNEQMVTDASADLARANNTCRINSRNSDQIIIKIIVNPTKFFLDQDFSIWNEGKPCHKIVVLGEKSL